MVLSYFTIEVKCPATSGRYDFKIPEKIMIKNLIEMIADEIRIYESNNELFKNINKLFILDEDYIPLNPSETAVQSGIINGSILMLI